MSHNECISHIALAARGLGNSSYHAGLAYPCHNIPSGFDFPPLILVFIYLDFCFIACISCKPPPVFC